MMTEKEFLFTLNEKCGDIYLENKYQMHYNTMFKLLMK